LEKSFNTYLQYSRHITKLINTRIATVSNKYKLTKLDAHALIFFSVDEHDPTASEFCKCGVYPKSNVSKSLLDLSNKGLVTMQPQKEDRRYQDVILTEKGKKIAEEIRKEINPIISKLSYGIDKEEKRIMFSAMHKLKNNIDILMKELD